MDDYPLLNLFWTMLLVFLWVLWFFLLYQVVTDIFGDQSLSGWAKAGWLICVLLLPYVGVFVYLVVRGKSMGQREMRQAQEREEGVRQYIRTAAAAGNSSVDELSKLSLLKDKGDISQDEFERAKTKLLA
ncbi:SHOCT domain-containing protein [Streptomyces sp. NPDC004980]